MNMSLENQENTPENQPNRPPEKIERDPTFWRSFNELENSEQFKQTLATEFLTSPLRAESAQEGTESDGFARRDFLKLMGASIALTSAAGCIRRPVQKIVPYNKQPEEVTIGVSNYYTSSFFDGQEGSGLLIKSKEGRPIHIEGNPDFPTNKGSASVRAQASLLSLYDPERLTKPYRNLLNQKRTNKESVSVSWDELDAKVLEALQKGSVAVLTGSIASPSTKAVVGDFCSAFKASHFQWDALPMSDVTEGQKSCYGEAVVPEYRYDLAKTIVSIDADFLGAWGPAMSATRLFAEGRRSPGQMSRLISFDSLYSLTGANADIRFKIKPSQQLKVALALANEVIQLTGSKPSGINYSVDDLASELAVSADRLKKIASELYKNRGQSLVIAGGLQSMTEDSKQLQIVVNLINSVLENEGKTIRAQTGTSNLMASYEDAFSLIAKMQSGAIKTLIIYRSNPLYSLPSSFGFQEALNQVETVVYIGDTMNETARLSHYVVTDNHSLETWGDTEFSRGLYGIHQPLIRSMYDTRSFQLSLMTWGFMGKVGPERLQKYETYYDYLRAYWRSEIASEISGSKMSDGDFEKFWNELLQKGF
jgi:MoCo/4Fe-4S cofactor protein with predicted Tat translocation signal